MLKTGMIVDNRYKILRELGRGGTSCVYLAENIRLHNYWAIKEVYKGGIIGDDAKGDMLIAESNILTKLRHPGLPTIVDILHTSGSCLIVMEYIEGISLDKALEKRGACAEADVVKWGRQLCDVLSYLHSQEPPIIYRDMKPANIMLKPDGNVVLIDFGLAREFKKHSQHDTALLGTHGYAAPEQYDNKRQTDARTDVYGLGVTLYHLVTGHDPSRPPYGIDSISTHNPALSGQLDAIIQKCIQLEPQQRFQSAAAVNNALKAIEDAESITTVLCETSQQDKKNHKWLWPVAIVSVAALLATILFFSSGEEKKPATDITTPATAATNAAGDKVMSYAEFAAAPVDSEVIIETYIQATQSRWEDKVTAWCQSPEGAYYVYGLQCTKENAQKLVPGTKVRIKGQKKQSSGALEIYFATFEFIEGDTFISQALDVTNLLGTEELSKHQNAKVAFTGMTVEKIVWQGEDLYVTLCQAGKSYEFCVEAELTGADTAVYKNAGKLKTGDVIDVEGFLYWSNGPVPRITDITNVDKAAAEPTMSAATIRLNRKDISFSYKGESWELYSGDVPKNLVTFSSDDNAVATFADGKITAVGNGVTQVYAAYGNQKVSCTIRCVFNETEASGEGSTTAMTGTIINVRTYVNVRSGPGTEYAKVGTLPLGQRVTITEVIDDGDVTGRRWGKTSAGWIPMDYVQLDP